MAEVTAHEGSAANLRHVYGPRIGPVRSRKLLARLWWALLPYAGWIGYRDKDLERDGTCVPPPWYAFPLAWAWKVVRRLPGSAPYEPLPPIECDCDYCRGVPGAVFEP